MKHGTIVDLRSDLNATKPVQISSEEITVKLGGKRDAVKSSQYSLSITSHICEPIVLTRNLK